MGSRGAMWRPIATIAAAARDVELEEPVLKLCWYSIYINLVLNIFIFLGGGPTLNLLILYPGTMYCRTVRDRLPIQLLAAAGACTRRRRRPADPRLHAFVICSWPRHHGCDSQRRTGCPTRPILQQAGEMPAPPRPPSRPVA